MNIDRVEFQLNSKCNMNCVFCFQNGNMDMEELDLKLASEVLDELDNTLKIAWITGGEPLLSASLLLSLIKDLKMRKLYTGLSTNGLLLKENIIGLKRSGLDEIRISLDSTDKHAYEKIRGRSGIYETVMENIISAVKIGFNVSLRCTITNKNVSAVSEVISEAKRWGVHRVELKSVLPIGRGSMMPMVPAGKLEKVFIEGVLKADQNTEIMVMCNHLPRCRGFAVENNFSCQCAHQYIYIYSDGSIAPCSYFPKENTFNVKASSIRHAWHSDFFKAVRSPYPSECQDCDYLPECRNGCPAVLFAYNKMNQYCFDVIGGVL